MKNNKVRLVVENANQCFETIKLLKEQYGLVRGVDFEFAFTREAYNRKYVEFDFVSEKYATFFRVKWI